MSDWGQRGKKAIEVDGGSRLASHPSKQRYSSHPIHRRESSLPAHVLPFGEPKERRASSGRESRDARDRERVSAAAAAAADRSSLFACFLPPGSPASAPSVMLRSSLSCASIIDR